MFTIGKMGSSSTLEVEKEKLRKKGKQTEVNENKAVATNAIVIFGGKGPVDLLVYTTSLIPGALIYGNSIHLHVVL